MTDAATFAWIADVFVLEPTAAALGVWLVETLLAHPRLQGLRWYARDGDAHALYERFGFDATATDGRQVRRRAYGTRRRS